MPEEKLSLAHLDLLEPSWWPPRPSPCLSSQAFLRLQTPNCGPSSFLGSSEVRHFSCFSDTVPCRLCGQPSARPCTLSTPCISRRPQLWQSPDPPNVYPPALSWNGWSGGADLFPFRARPRVARPPSRGLQFVLGLPDFSIDRLFCRGQLSLFVC